MNVDLMRWVDHWVGVPLCFFLTILSYIQKILGLRKVKKDFVPKKILFIELSEMGSTVLAYGSMKKAKEMYNSEIYFMIFKENVQSVEMLDVIPKKNIITIRGKNLFYLGIDTIRALIKIRRLKIDSVVDLELFSRFTAILSYLSGAKAISGFYKYHMEGLYRGNFQTHKVEYNPHIHISQSFMALVNAFGADLSQVPLLKQHIKIKDIETAKIISTNQQKEKMLNKLKRYNDKITMKSKIVLLNPNASQLLPIRKWPLENFIEVGRKVLEQKDAFIVVTGVESEKEDAIKVCNSLNDERCIDFTGQTNLRELVDLYNISKVIVSNDSGPAHFASLTDIRIVVLFGPETPKLYSPLSKNCFSVYSYFACSPCVSAFNHRKTPCNNSLCLKAIKVKEVFDIVNNGLQ